MQRKWSPEPDLKTTKAPKVYATKRGAGAGAPAPAPTVSIPDLILKAKQDPDWEKFCREPMEDRKHCGRPAIGIDLTRGIPQCKDHAPGGLFHRIQEMTR